MQERDFPEIGRWVSIFDRLMKMYYDRGLSGYEIGWGQQFYVEYLREHPGATSQEMAERFRVDKATLTKIPSDPSGFLRDCQPGDGPGGAGGCRAGAAAHVRQHQSEGMA